MAALPPARTVLRPSWRHWLALVACAVAALAVPIAAWVLIPSRHAWVRWVFALVPLIGWGVALTTAGRGGASRWALVLDPARRADARRAIYVVFDLLFTIGYLIALRYFIPNRHDWAMLLLYLLPLSTWLMATGTALGRAWSWWLTIAGGVAMLVWMVAVMIVLLYTASYLAGVYGAFGRGASAGLIGIAAVLVEIVALLPALQLKWALTRAGRRAFGLAPLWRAPVVVASAAGSPA